MQMCSQYFVSNDHDNIDYILNENYLLQYNGVQLLKYVKLFSFNNSITVHSITIPTPYFSPQIVQKHIIII